MILSILHCAVVLLLVSPITPSIDGTPSPADLNSEFQVVPSESLQYTYQGTYRAPLAGAAPVLNAAKIELSALQMRNIQVTDGQEDRTEEEYDSRALGYFMDGELYMMQGQYREAADAYRQALSYDSSSATIYLNLGEALFQQDLLEPSKRAGEKALDLQPDEPMIYEFLARNAAARESYDEAIQHLNTWAELDHTSVDPLYNKASLLLQQRKYPEAIDTYLAIYERDPIQQQVLPQAAEIAISIGDFERAFQVFHQLYQLQPDNYQIVLNYAELGMQTDHLEEAIEAYEHLDQLGGTTTQISLQLALLHFRMDNLAKAQAILAPLIERGYRQWDVLNLSAYIADRGSDYEHLAKVSALMLEVYPDSVGGYTGLAIARNNLDDAQGAIEILEQAVLRFPSDPVVNRLLGYMYLSADKSSQAEKYLLAALELQPSENSIRHLLATAWSDMGKYEAADSLYEVLLKSDKKDASALNNYAYSIAERSQVSLRQLWYARKLSRKSLKLQPENSAFLDTYGWVWYRLKFYRIARKYIARSIDIQPDNPVVLDHLSDVYRKLGDSDQADEYSNRAEQVREESSNSIVRADDE